MGEWCEVKPRPYSPCDGCEVGSCSITQKTVDGKLYTKTDDCTETCERLKQYRNEPEHREHLFFNNAREAYAVITKKDRARLQEMAIKGW